MFVLRCSPSIQLQWSWHLNRVKEAAAAAAAAAEHTNIQYFTIAFWNHVKYLNYLYASLFPIPLFVCACWAVFWCSAVYYPPSDWYRVYILSLEQSRGAHAQSSFNICSNPCSPCRLNASYFWYFPALNAAIQTSGGVSHPPVLSERVLSLLRAQMANTMRKGNKERRRNDRGMEDSSQWIPAYGYLLWGWQIFHSGMSRCDNWALNGTTELTQISRSDSFLRGSDSSGTQTWSRSLIHRWLQSLTTWRTLSSRRSFCQLIGSDTILLKCLQTDQPSDQRDGQTDENRGTRFSHLESPATWTF